MQIPATQNHPTLERCAMSLMLKLPTGGNSLTAKMAAIAHVPSTPASRPQRMETAVTTTRNSSHSTDFDPWARKSAQETLATEQQIATPKRGLRTREVRVRQSCIPHLPTGAIMAA